MSLLVEQHARSGAGTRAKGDRRARRVEQFRWCTAWMCASAGILSGIAAPACGSIVIDERVTSGGSGAAGGASGGNTGGSNTGGSNTGGSAVASGSSFAGTGGMGNCFASQVMDLASGQLGIVGMAVNTTNLFWMNGFANEIVTVPKSGGPVSVIISGGTMDSFAVDDSNVYWEGSSEKGLNGIIVTPLSGGPSKQLVSNVKGAEIALDHDHVYWAVKGESEILSVPKSGGEPLMLVVGATAPRGLAVDQDRLYWMQDDGEGTQIMAKPKLGGEAIMLAGSSLGASKLIVDDARLYWSDSAFFDSNEHHRLQSLSTMGGQADTLSSSVLEPVYGIAVDAACVYWTTGANSAGEDRLLAVSKGGGDPVELAMGGGYYELLVVDETGIYLGDKHKGNVVRLGK